MESIETKGFDFAMSSPIGMLGLVITDQAVSQISYLPKHSRSHIPQHGFAFEVYKQIVDYFELRRTCFELPLDIRGTPYQKKVWQSVARINYGESKTYGEIAAAIHSGPRAVGNACRSNPIPIMIPCHRVVKKVGIGGYCGSTEGVQVQHKDWLLQHEQGTMYP